MRLLQQKIRIKHFEQIGFTEATIIQIYFKKAFDLFVVPTLLFRYIFKKAIRISFIQPPYKLFTQLVALAWLPYESSVLNVV